MIYFINFSRSKHSFFEMLTKTQTWKLKIELENAECNFWTECVWGYILHHILILALNKKDSNRTFLELSIHTHQALVCMSHWFTQLYYLNFIFSPYINDMDFKKNIIKLNQVKLCSYWWKKNDSKNIGVLDPSPTVSFFYKDRI